MPKHRSRSAAARKGWRTRRANHARRSAAARKGWRTRRKNQAKKKPSKKEFPEFVGEDEDFDFGEDEEVSP